MATDKQLRRVAAHRKAAADKASVIDMHDLLHSIFWNKPSREELARVRKELDAVLKARKVDMMKAEIRELLEDEA
jgi:hypothetical protein